MGFLPRFEIVSKWESLHISSHRLEVEYPATYCLDCGVEAQTVTSGKLENSDVDDVKTLFELAARALDSGSKCKGVGTARADVVYDDEYGYPTLVPSPIWADYTPDRVDCIGANVVRARSLVPIVEH